MHTLRPQALLFSMGVPLVFSLPMTIPLSIGFDPPITAFRPDRVSGLLRLLGMIAWCAVLGHASWRCYCAFVRLESDMPRWESCIPGALCVAHLVAFAAVVAAGAFGSAYGPFIPLGCFLFFVLTALSHFAFVLAAAQVEAAYRNEQVRTTLLSLLYHLGGFGGILLAKRTFRDSPAFEEFPTRFPRGVLIAGGFACFLYVYGTLFNFGNLGTFKPSRPEHETESETPSERLVDDRPAAPFVNSELLYRKGNPHAKP